MKLRSIIRNTIFILWTISGLVAPSRAQVYPNNFELTCPAGSVPSSADNSVGIDPSNNKYRAIICYNPANGVSTWNDATSSSGSGVTSFDGRTGAVVPLLDDYESLLLTAGATLDAPISFEDSLGAGLSDISGNISLLSASNTLTLGSALTLNSGNFIAPALIQGRTLQSTVATGTAPLIVASTTNVPNLNASSLNGATFAATGAIGSTTPSTGVFTTVRATTGINMGASGATICSATAPTISSGFGTGPSIVNQNGTCAFTVNVGTGGTASAGVIGLPAATTGWVCHVDPNGAPQAGAVTYPSPTSASSTTLTNYTAATGVALAWTASTVLQVSCFGY